MNEAQTNLTMLPQYLDHLPEGSSVRPFVHYSQSYLSGLFCNYDFEEENNAHYGSDTPPEYDLSLVTAPVALLSGGEHIRFRFCRNKRKKITQPLK